MRNDTRREFWVDHLSGYEHALQLKGGAIAAKAALDGGASWAGTEQAKEIDGLVRAQAMYCDLV